MHNINIFVVNIDLLLNHSENKGSDLKKSFPFWESF